MDNHEIKAQAEAVQAALGLDAAALPTIEAALAECWKDRIALVWTVEDIHVYAENMGYKLTDDDAIEVLHQVLHAHDASQGVCWATFDPYLIGYPEVGEDEEDEEDEEEDDDLDDEDEEDD